MKAMKAMKAKAATPVKAAAMKAMKAKAAAPVKGAVMKAMKAKAAALYQNKQNAVIVVLKVGTLVSARVSITSCADFIKQVAMCKRSRLTYLQLLILNYF